MLERLTFNENTNIITLCKVCWKYHRHENDLTIGVDNILACVMVVYYMWKTCAGLGDWACVLYAWCVFICAAIWAYILLDLLIGWPNPFYVLFLLDLLVNLFVSCNHVCCYILVLLVGNTSLCFFLFELIEEL